MRPPLRVFALLPLLAVMSGRSTAQITIYRDRFGTPSIHAARVGDAVYGLGYCMAIDGAERMLRNFKTARGRISEVDGRAYLFEDALIRAVGFERLAEAHAPRMSPEEGMLVRSFCAGANRAIAAQKGRLPDWVEPVTPVDVLAFSQFVNSAFPLLDVSGKLFGGQGSNEFVVAPKRSANGHAIVSIDPHLQWQGYFAWYEFALYTDAFAFHGITLFGLPGGVMGHTNDVAWAMTNNDPRLYDLYRVETSTTHPDQYNAHGEWKPFVDEHLTLRYREGGTLKTTTQVMRQTEWGPIAPFHNVAVRMATLGHWNMIPQAYAMARAHTAAQFRNALHMRGLSMWNLAYADTHGSIGYQYNALVPERDPAIDWSGPVSGADPRTRWGPVWDLDRLPHIENPRSGLLVNCNSAPWLTPVDGEMSREWPNYVTAYGHTSRYDRLSALLTADPLVTLAAARRIATDTLVPYSAATVQAIVSACGSDAALAPAVKVLSQWDLRSDVASRGCALFFCWLHADAACEKLALKSGSAPWSAEDQALARRALAAATQTLNERHVPLDTPWSAFHFSRHNGQTGGISGFSFGASEEMAAVVPNMGRLDADGINCSFGSSFRMIVDLDPHGVRSWSILPYGNSRIEGSEHATDQMDLFGRGLYKDTLFGLPRTRTGAKSVMHLAVDTGPNTP